MDLNPEMRCKTDFDFKILDTTISVLGERFKLIKSHGELFDYCMTLVKLKI